MIGSFRSYRISCTRFLLSAALAGLGCTSSDPGPRTPVAEVALSHTTGCALSCQSGETFGDDWCEGGNWWWYLRGVFFTNECVDDVSVKVYVITAAGERVFFGNDPHVQAVRQGGCGTERQFVVQSIAPRDSIGDNDRGFPQFAVEVYAGERSEPFGTFTVYSDIQLSPNTDYQRPVCDNPPYPDPDYPKRQNPDKEHPDL